MPDIQSDTQPESQPVKQAPVAPEDPREKAAQLRAEAASIEAALPVAPGAARLKVAPPHHTFTVAGINLGPDFTDVPESMLAKVMQSAAEAGVTLTTQEG